MEGDKSYAPTVTMGGDKRGMAAEAERAGPQVRTGYQDGRRSATPRPPVRQHMWLRAEDRDANASGVKCAICHKLLSVQGEYRHPEG